MRRWNVVPLILILVSLAGCALSPAGMTNPSAPPPDNTKLTISPATANVRAGQSQSFVPSITNTPLIWSVNGVAGGNGTDGTIDSTGFYTAPLAIPSGAITITAAQASKSSVTASSTVAVWNPIPQLSAVSPAQINVGSFTLTVTGSNFVSGAVVGFGGVPLTVKTVTATQIVATGTATSAQIGTVSVNVQNPNPGESTSNSMNAQVASNSAPQVSANIASRFAQQTTFGATSGTILKIQAAGLQGYLNQQLALPVTQYPQPGGSETGIGLVQQRFYMRAITANDQLRQRVAFALSEIFALGASKIADPNGETQWLQILEKDSFGNYRTLMYDVTTSPAMGHWLDMVNNGKPTSADQHANENYARELMQLFTIGTAMLNPDGSVQTGSGGEPIPTYSQAQVQEFALAYTGWTYPVTQGNSPQKYNPMYFVGPMVAVDTNHDQTAKQLLTYSGVQNGGLLPAGQTTVNDLNGALDNIFNHPNVGPFVCRRLIQHLVTSNPSPEYVQRVAAVFDNNGSNVRGDMKAVITAILMDQEARRGDDPSTAVGTDGHLQEPILYMTGLLRMFNATTLGSSLAYQGSTMGENVLDTPSVFNFFSPSYVIPQTNTYGPEFQILTTSTALYRANWTNNFVFNTIAGDTTVNYSSWAQQAANPSAMLDSLNTLMLHGTMSADMRTSILTAMQGVYGGSSNPMGQAQAAIYLIATSSQYQIAR